MSWWRFWERKSLAALDYSVLGELFRQVNSKAGQPVTLRTALEVTTVLCCARVIAEGMAQVPFKLFRPERGGGRVEAADHPASVLLNRAPNEWQTAFELREQIGLHLALTNNAFVFKNLGSDGELLELYAFEPGSVIVTRYADLSISYQVTLLDGTRVPIPSDQMWHVRGPSWNGYMGLDALYMARNAIGLSLATEEFASALFANGARPGGLLTTEQKPGDETLAAIKETWTAAHAGSGNALKTVLLTGGLKYQPLSQTADEAQFIETRKSVVPEICRAFRVLPIMVMHDENQAGYASVEQRFIAHVTHTLMPWYERLDQSAAVNLLSPAEQKAGMYFRHMAAQLMRGTAIERANYLAIMRQNGVITANQWLDEEDLPRSDDPKADELLYAANIYGPPAGAPQDATDSEPGATE